MNQSQWSYVYASAIGTSHADREEPCQDASLVRQVMTRQGPHLVACCSDGAGSAFMAAEGAALACESFIRHATQRLGRSEGIDTISQNEVAGWIGQIAGELSDLARKHHAETRETACTLLAAIVGPTDALFIQIGDGAIVVDQPNQRDYDIIFWPQMGEYAGTTNFVTDRHAQSAFVFQYMNRPVQRLAMFTDGLQMLGLDFNQRLPHGPFFDPLFHALLRQPDPTQLAGPFEDFLVSDDVNARTDDDRTLILAARRAASVAPTATE